MLSVITGEISQRKASVQSTSSRTSESQSVSVNSESSLLDSSTTDQMSSSSTFVDSNCYEITVSNFSSVVTNDDINGDTVCEILREQQTACSLPFRSARAKSPY